MLYPQIVGGLRAAGVMNSSWSISDDDATRSISLTLSLLQSQLLLVTGVSRLSTTNSSLMKQMSELSLGSLY